MDTDMNNNEISDIINLAQRDPPEFLRIFYRGQQAPQENTPTSTTPPTEVTSNSQMEQLIAALRDFTTTATRPSLQPQHVRKETVKVTPFDGNPETLHRFLAELDSKVTLERWDNEPERLILAESLLVKDQRADRLMNAHRVRGRTTLTTL
jgi:hypothetical protein